MSPSISLDQIQELKSQLQERAAVLSPGSEGYHDGLERWSAVGLQQAVLSSLYHVLYSITNKQNI